MKRSLDNGICVLLAAIVVGAVGCASAPVVTSQQASFSTSQIQQIEVFPVLDGRRVVQDKFNFERTTKGLPKRVSRSLKKKGYECLDADGSASLGGLVPAQIPFASADQVRKIGSGRARWVLVPVVEEMCEVGDIKLNEITFYLFDRQAGRLTWEGSGNHPRGVSQAMDGVLQKFPGKKK